MCQTSVCLRVPALSFHPRGGPAHGRLWRRHPYVWYSWARSVQLPWRLVLRLLLPARLRRRWQNLRRYGKGRVNISRSVCVKLAFHRDEVREVTFKHKQYITLRYLWYCMRLWATFQSTLDLTFLLYRLDKTYWFVFHLDIRYISFVTLHTVETNNPLCCGAWSW